MKIRSAHPKDLHSVYNVEKASFKDPYPLAFIEALYCWNPNTFLVAEKDGQIVGYIIATTKRDVGHIVSIAVHSSERRKRVGWILMTTTLHVLKDMDVRSVRLEVRSSSTTAQKFYEALGFQHSHTAPEYYRDEDAFVYLKLL